MLLLDLTHTSHTPARTGIQRVARAIYRHLGDEATPVTRDPFLGEWRQLEPWEISNLENSLGEQDRRLLWPKKVQWRGRFQRALGRADTHALRGSFDGWIEPEIFSPSVANDLKRGFALVKGPKVALFLDAIALKLPELMPAATVARFPSYLKELLMFDGIAAISEESRESLVEYWKWLGILNTPPVIALPLGVDVTPASAAAPNNEPTDAAPVVLNVGTLEGRKNHLSLLAACEELWSRGMNFELRLVGHLDPKTGQPAFERIQQLKDLGRNVRYEGPATDSGIDEAYARCSFTVYPSRAEGFGLPVIESLTRGKPCICLGKGALGEISTQGGCVPLPDVEPATLATAIARLLTDPAERAALSQAAAKRRFKSWADYTAELTTWLRSLRSRS